MKKSDLSYLVETLSRHLDSISARYSVEDIELSLLSCPNDISVLSIVQTYIYLGLEAKAFKADYPSIIGEKKPFVAHLKKDDEEKFVYVKSATIDSVVYFDGNIKKKITSSDFQSQWTGVAIIVNKTPQNSIFGAKCHKYLPYLFLIGIILLLCSLCSSIIDVVTFLLDVVGFICSLGIILTQSPLYSLFDKFCIANTKFDCQKLDLADRLPMLNKKNLGRVGLLYFATRLFIPSLSIWDVDSSAIISIMNVLALCALTVALCSLLYQVAIRHYCILCLSVMGVLIVESAIVYFNSNIGLPLPYDNMSYVIIPILFGVGCLWLAEYMITCKHKLMSQRVNELKNKRTQDMVRYYFDSPSKTINNKESISIGNQQAPISITTYISPWCPNCKQIALQMIRLIKVYSNYVNWHIYFDSLNTAQFENINNIQICLCGCLTSNLSEKQKLDVLQNWYMHKSKRILRKRFKVMNANEDQSKAMLLRQIDVIKGVKHVPSVWINGRRFPDNYSLNDLPFIMLELSMIYSNRDTNH